MPQHEAPGRIVARVVTWRLGGVLLGILIGWLVTGNFVLGAEFGILYNGVRLLTHFAHEFIWARKIRWGLVGDGKAGTR